MGTFTLPSGRVIETKENLTWGDELHVISVGLRSAEDYSYAKASVVVPGLTHDDVAGLSREDGRALSNEVNRIFDGRPEEKEIPFGNTSSSPSPEEPPSSQSQ